jgi:hypothetical protein
MTGVGPLVWQRLLASWRLLSVLAFGVLIAATLLAASPVYTRVMNDLGLRASLQDVLRNAGSNGALQFGLPLGSPQAASSAQSMTMELQTLSDFEDKVNVTEGRLPQPTNDPGQLEAVIPASAAAIVRIRPGDQLYVAQTFDDCNRPPPTTDPLEQAERARFPCVPQASITLTAQLTVVGFISPKDPDDIFWSAGGFSFQAPQFTEEPASPKWTRSIPPTWMRCAPRSPVWDNGWTHAAPSPTWAWTSRYAPSRAAPPSIR